MKDQKVSIYIELEDNMLRMQKAHQSLLHVLQITEIELTRQISKESGKRSISEDLKRAWLRTIHLIFKIRDSIVAEIAQGEKKLRGTQTEMGKLVTEITQSRHQEETYMAESKLTVYCSFSVNSISTLLETEQHEHDIILRRKKTGVSFVGVCLFL